MGFIRNLFDNCLKTNESNDNIIKKYKEKNEIKNDLIHILRDLRISENRCIKSKVTTFNGYFKGIDDGFYLFYPLANGAFIRFVLPLKYWDMFY